MYQIMIAKGTSLAGPRHVLINQKLDHYLTNEPWGTIMNSATFY